MRFIAFTATFLTLAATLSACASTNSTVQRTDRFTGMTFSMPVGATFK